MGLIIGKIVILQLKQHLFTITYFKQTGSGPVFLDLSMGLEVWPLSL